MIVAWWGKKSLNALSVDQFVIVLPFRGLVCKVCSDNIILSLVHNKEKNLLLEKIVVGN